MSLNPLELIDKWINERGSSQILRERLTQLGEQFTLLQQKLLAALEENSRLTCRVADLETENANLDLVIKNRDEQIEVLTKRLDPTHTQLHANEEKILCHLVSIESATAEDIASTVGIQKQTAQFHLEQLRDRSLVKDFDAYINTMWSLTQSGRKATFEMGLLK